MKVAVIGAGRVGGLHAGFLAQAADVVLVADADQQRARALAKRIGGVAVADVSEALAAADAAVVATPPDTHAALVRTAVDLSRPVLCEKPLAATLAEAVELADHVTERGVLVELGFQRRFDSEYLAAHDAIRSGRVGRLHLLRLQSTEPGLAPSPKTNLFRNTAVHDFDLIRWLSGDAVVSIYVEGADRTGEEVDVRRDPDSIVATMRLSRGALAVATVDRLSPRGYDVRAEVLGSDDHLAVGFGPRTPLRLVGNGCDRLGSTSWDSWQTRFAPAFQRELAAFLDAVNGQPPQGATLADAVHAQRLAEAARESMEQRMPIRLEAS